MNPTAATSAAARIAVRDHVTLRSLVAQALAAFGGPTALGSTGPDVVAARLDTLRGALRAHFDEEERAGLFDDIEAGAPELAAACDLLRRDHQRLMQRLDRLRAATPVERRGPAWSREVRSLAEDLEAHEDRESALLLRALDAGTPAVD